MSDDQELPAWARARRPVARPIWLRVLAMAMLVSGGLLLKWGTAELSTPRLERVLSTEGVPAHLVAPMTALRVPVTQVYRAHPLAGRVNAVATVVMGAVMLFAVAALMTSDPRARQATLVAAGMRIAYELGDMTFHGQILRLAARKVPSDKDPTLGALISGLDLSTVAGGLIGILLGVVLLTFFGGHRGRAFFGAGPGVARRQPHHGG
jgi:hypothetical protein